MDAIGKTYKRDIGIDILKCIAIYLVVLGHSIQNCDVNFMRNTLFEFIYSFHMPLFAFISGFVSYNSNSYSLKDFVRKRSIQILLPAFSWSFIVLITTIILNRPEHYMGVIKPNFLYYAWFLKCIWVCSIITFICTKYLKTTFAFITLSFLCLILGCFQDLGNMFWVSFLLPVYVLGMFFSILLNYIKRGG